MDDEIESARRVARELRRVHEGILRVGDRLDPCRFVLDAATGNPVVPVRGDVFDSDEVTLHTPDDGDHALHLLGRPVEVDPARHAGPDRFLTYLGKPSASRWALLEVDSVKTFGTLLDAGAVVAPDPLRGFEAGLCKRVNTDVAALAALARGCGRRAGTTPTEPRLVGVDRFGVDLRGRFGVIRAEFRQAAETEEAAWAAIGSIISEGFA